ncbi:hypothetical protein ACFWGE_09215 [Streptomyces bacillaris]|uniref:Uncharacterized protein n=1 Tax=Streptomyces cavourensis TaxID=67258 RepID=A0AAD0VHA9_9ACTN|nr:MULTISPECIES: hypothetical protein [Streptomyces]NUW24771.1 hypothetical protein [Streptomyces roseoviolaceus]AXI74828.1 hypothetical protein DTW94_28625 [Streptomyces cavourensis]NUV43129.1 hypothetical protein [Streptomyces sp. CAI-24]NUV84068.1 hypothetical protein [Streptomyces sp. CAI-155]NUV90605.1 hypothetical protein [Streptomyces sp. KAI-26]
MKKLIEAVGFIILLQGIGGLVYEWTGWLRLWTPARHMDFFGDRALFVSIVLIVTGFAIMIAPDAVRKKS